MWEMLEQLPLSYALIGAATLGLAPFVPEPHIWEKLKMIKAGTLKRPIDVFDFLLHAAPFVVLVAKLVQMAIR